MEEKNIKNLSEKLLNKLTISMQQVMLILQVNSNFSTSTASAMHIVILTKCADTTIAAFEDPLLPIL